MSERVALLWLRRDLRLHDHPALCAAAAADRLVPVFCLDDRLLAGRHGSGPRTRFLLESLEALSAALRERGSGLVVCHGRPERELPALASELGARELHLTADVGPFARARDERVCRELEATGAEVHAHPGLFVVDDPGVLRSGAGTPYTVFTPFFRAWAREHRRPALDAPETLPLLPARVSPGELPSAQALGLADVAPDALPGGEAAGLARSRGFLDGPVRGYGRDRQLLGGGSASRLSPYLHFGCLSALALEGQLPAGEGAAAYRRQLAWRDFYAQVLFHHPVNARAEHQERYRGRLSWSHSRRRFSAWCEGATGYPVVDAGMRQLRAEGWMHNRARLIAASFLTKQLGIDWRWGERWFMRWLIDGDEASNNGNWQWIASVGVDPQPPYRRLYNPTLQQRRFDPAGAYVRRYVPELARVPDEYLPEPWTMPEDVQRQAECLIGRDYPEPIVDHAVARRQALERYAQAAA